MIGTSAASLVLALAVAALLGSIPFGFLIARAASGADVRKVGSGNIGATNVFRASGPLPAALTLALDIGKGSAAVLLARVIGSGGPHWWGPTASGFGVPTHYDYAGVVAVAGHAFSPWLGFKGGKGVATAAGVILVLSPALAGVGLAVFAAVVAVGRIVSLASIAAALAVVVAEVGGHIALRFSTLAFPPPSQMALITICALILIRHADNISRLLKGEEPALGSKQGSRGRRS